MPLPRDRAAPPPRRAAAIGIAGGGIARDRRLGLVGGPGQIGRVIGAAAARAGGQAEQGKENATHPAASRKVDHAVHPGTTPIARRRQACRHRR
ncbi:MULTISPECIES: hypothetical protein [unclassified Sphingomonas]|uniref:hypothetical protein n=1 Tax=unclassified Sphingomonas TaxID=196159 RepID=UPI002269E767|nr:MULTISPECIES: hypothetical protein [unclassified Sphingomonas]